MPDTDPLDFLICSTCGTQYSVPTGLTSCKICDDPRQYVPPTGQSWTTLRSLQTPGNQEPKYKNIFTPDPIHSETLISIHTEPKLAIGQRAYLCRTRTTSTATPTSSDSNSNSNQNKQEQQQEQRPAESFNILWDCITYIDARTIAQINDLGGIHAIVISHPHYYTTHLAWADIFKCPVFLAAEDREWVCRFSPQKGESLGRQIFFTEAEIGLTPSLVSSASCLSKGAVVGEDGGGADLVAIKTGGHFPGSLVLWWKSLRTLLIADSIAVVPSARYWVGRPAGTASFTFMWSYPNMIPLNADEVHNIWNAIKHTDFEITRGAFIGMDTDKDSKKRLLDSAKIFVKAMGYLDHPIHQEECL